VAKSHSHEDFHHFQFALVRKRNCQQTFGFRFWCVFVFRQTPIPSDDLTEKIAIFARFGRLPNCGKLRTFAADCNGRIPLAAIGAGSSVGHLRGTSPRDPRM
jgi:hypothetical protein